MFLATAIPYALACGQPICNALIIVPVDTAQYISDGSFICLDIFLHMLTKPAVTVGSPVNPNGIKCALFCSAQSFAYLFKTGIAAIFTNFISQWSYANNEP